MTTAPSPLWLPNRFNGYPRLRFNGNSMLSIATTGIPFPDVFTFIIVARCDATQDSDTPGTLEGRRLIWCDYSAGSGLPLSAGSNGVAFFSGDPSGTPVASVVADATRLCPLIVRYRREDEEQPGILDIRLRGNDLGSFAAPSFETSMSREIGRLQFDFVGEVAEILIFSRALEESERIQVESYLNSKYGGCESPSSSSSESQSSESSVMLESSSSSSSKFSESSESISSDSSVSSDSSDSSEDSSEESSIDSSESSSSESSSSSSSESSNSSASERALNVNNQNHIPIEPFLEVNVNTLQGALNETTGYMQQLHCPQ